MRASTNAGGSAMGDIGSSANLNISVYVETDAGDLPDPVDLVHMIDLAIRAYGPYRRNREYTVRHLEAEGDYYVEGDKEDPAVDLPDCPDCGAQGGIWVDVLYSGANVKDYECSRCAYVWTV
jgi:hypothetical protein